MANGKNGKVLLRVRPRGFCAGVVRAVDIVELALEAYGAPVYARLVLPFVGKSALDAALPSREPGG